MAVDLLVIRGNYLTGRWERPVGVQGVKPEVSKINKGRGKVE